MRALVPADRDWLAATLNDFFQELATHAPGLFAADAGRVYADLYLAGDGNRFARVSGDDAAQSEESHAAILLGRIVQRPARLPARVLLIDIAFTRPAFRSRGLMSQLIDAAKAWCRDREVARLELGTPVAGPARAYWERRGFASEFVTMSRDMNAS